MKLKTTVVNDQHAYPVLVKWRFGIKEVDIEIYITV